MRRVYHELRNPLQPEPAIVLGDLAMPWSLSKVRHNVRRKVDWRMRMDAVIERAGLAEQLEAAATVGMTTAVWAEAQPDKAAVIDPDGRSRTFAQVNANANRIVRLLRQAGLKS